jgi:multiple sugar transport system permease protein
MSALSSTAPDTSRASAPADVTGGGSGGAPSQRRRRSIQAADRRYALLLIAPAALVLLVLVGWPIVKLVSDSLYTGGGLGGGAREFAGLSNYSAVLHTPQLIDSAWRTLAYTALVVSAEFVLGLGAALLFHALGNRARLFRTVFLYPLMVAPVVAGLLWRFLMIDNFGILNELLHRFGVLRGSSDIQWLSDTHIVLFSVAIPDIWLTTSFMTLLLFTGLQSLPQDIYEAARLDGARGPQTLFHITIPLLRPVIAVALIIRGVDAARAFDVIRIQTNGGPQNASQTLSLSIYDTSVRFGEQGVGSAASTLFVVVMMLLALIGIVTIWRPGVDTA